MVLGGLFQLTWRLNNSDLKKIQVQANKLKNQVILALSLNFCSKDLIVKSFSDYVDQKNFFFLKRAYVRFTLNKYAMFVIPPKPVIYVNQNKTDNFFTSVRLLHELGHFFWHYVDSIFPPTVYDKRLRHKYKHKQQQWEEGFAVFFSFYFSQSLFDYSDLIFLTIKNQSMTYGLSVYSQGIDKVFSFINQNNTELFCQLPNIWQHVEQGYVPVYNKIVSVPWKFNFLK